MLKIFRSYPISTLTVLGIGLHLIIHFSGTNYDSGGAMGLLFYLAMALTVTVWMGDEFLSSILKAGLSPDQKMLAAVGIGLLLALLLDFAIRKILTRKNESAGVRN